MCKKKFKNISLVNKSLIYLRHRKKQISLTLILFIMKNYLLNQIELTKDNKSLFFENYVFNNALEVLQDKGEDALKLAINDCINDKLMSPAQRLFFIELNTKFN